MADLHELHYPVSLRSRDFVPLYGTQLARLFWSDYPIGLLKTAGTDMTTNEPFDMSIAFMNRVMDEIDKILDKN